MWLLLAFVSAAFLGLYDVAKKLSLKDNAVLPVLFLNTLFSSLIFLPPIILSYCGGSELVGDLFFVPQADWNTHRLIILKAFLVLGSWVCGYFAIKHLPLTIAGPINASRPVVVLIGAMLVFGERLNAWQWVGAAFAIVSFFLLSRSGRKEGINFVRNRWILLLVIAMLLGAASGLYDKYLLARVDRMVVQSWFNLYQLGIMGTLLVVMHFSKRDGTPFVWRWSILLISVFLAAADFVYYYALSIDGSLISVVSMVRRSSVIVSFAGGVLLFKEKNVKGKIIDLALVIIGMVFLYLGSRL